jgi:hypothetical protein
MIVVPSIPKITVSIAGERLPRDILPPEGAPGSAKMMVDLVVETRGASVSAQVSGRLYRQTLKRVDACEHGAMVHLNGMLDKENRIVDAGLMVFPLPPKE